MRYQKYLELKDLKLGLVKEKTDHEEVVREADVELGGSVLMDLKKEINSKLKETYSGEYMFDYCIQEGKDINKLRIPEARKLHLKKEWFKISDEVAKSKTLVERKMSSDTDEGSSTTR